MSPNDVWIVIDAYHEDQQQEWERARVIAYNIHIHAPYMKRKEKSIQSFLPFPWDKKLISRTQARLQEYLNNKKKNGG
jgi:hypothetical protein